MWTGGGERREVGEIIIKIKDYNDTECLKKCMVMNNKSLENLI
jgi:hypothetical protein